MGYTFRFLQAGGVDAVEGEFDPELVGLFASIGIKNWRGYARRLHGVRSAHLCSRHQDLLKHMFVQAIYQLSCLDPGAGPPARSTLAPHREPVI
jgi:hypothetical protein